MPIYEYACTTCGERTEAKQRFTDPPLETCPVCGGKLRKLYSPVGVVFKGSGFYSTDARKPKAPAASAKDDKAPAREPKTEPKTHTKGEAAPSKREKSA